MNNIERLDKSIADYIKHSPEVYVEGICDNLVAYLNRCNQAYNSTDKNYNEQVEVSSPDTSNDILGAYGYKPNASMIIIFNKIPQALKDFAHGVPSYYILPVYRYFAKRNLFATFYYNNFDPNHEPSPEQTLAAIEFEYNDNLELEDPQKMPARNVEDFHVLGKKPEYLIPMHTVMNSSYCYSFQRCAYEALKYFKKDAVAIEAIKDAETFMNWFDSIIPMLYNAECRECRGFISKHGAIVLEFLSPCLGTEIGDKWKGRAKNITCRGEEGEEYDSYRYAYIFKNEILKHWGFDIKFYDNINNPALSRPLEKARAKFAALRRDEIIPWPIIDGDRKEYNKAVDVKMECSCIAMDSIEFRPY